MDTEQFQTSPVAALDVFEKKMTDAGMDHIVFENFAFYYKQFRKGNTGYLLEKDIESVKQLPTIENLDDKDRMTGNANLHKVVNIKLNGGLGTSMGLDRAKSLLPVKNGLSFLEIIIEQMKQKDAKLILMNSFATHEDSLNVLKEKLPAEPDLPIDFLQNQIPKIEKATGLPVEFPDDPKLEWCPPGHGDLYIALLTSGVLDKLLAAGYQYAFVSNADNLGAVLNKDLLGYFINQNFDFMMEVAQRTPADKKGGHLAKQNGKFILRESAQCHSDDKNAFENIAIHRFFNTNNLWIDLSALKKLVEERNHLMQLPLIVNHKKVNPQDDRSPDVIQLETAMGSAISSFQNSGAILVDRSRFIPVKDTNQLFKVRSDLYKLSDTFNLIAEKAKYNDIHVELDQNFYKNLHDFQKRFGHNIPSLLECNSFQVDGNVYFDKKSKASGDVHIINKSSHAVHLADSHLSGTLEF